VGNSNDGEIIFPLGQRRKKKGDRLGEGGVEEEGKSGMTVPCLNW